MDDERQTFLGRIKDKLIRSKEGWARDGTLLIGEAGDGRLPPGQRLVKDWPVLDLGVQPKIPLSKWRLAVDGLVENPLSWDWDDFLAQPETEIVSDIHCVTAWSRYDNHWRGVSARHILATVRPGPEAEHIVFHGYDGYTTNVPRAMFEAPDVLIAHSWEGEPIPRGHGGPVRVVIPKLYFWKSAKWLKRIEFLAQDRPGFWEERGYHNEGDPWREERYG